MPSNRRVQTLLLQTSAVYSQIKPQYTVYTTIVYVQNSLALNDDIYKLTGAVGFPRKVLQARGEVLPYMGYISMCRCCEGYGFQPVYSRIGYINQSVWV